MSGGPSTAPRCHSGRQSGALWKPRRRTFIMPNQYVRGSCMSQRQATVSRDTLETQVSVSVNLDGTGVGELESGVPFLDHMLDQIVRHGLIDLTVKAKGDTWIDDHQDRKSTRLNSSHVAIS